MFVGFNVTFLPMHFTGLRGMPRRIFTYPEGMGWDWLNLVSTVGAFVFAAGVLILVIDVLRPKGREPCARRNPWNAGTLEWLTEMPGAEWGVRSVPIIESRYPLWDQPEFMRKVDEGRFYIPDAEEGRRETLVTSTLDAEPLQCLRVPGNTFLTLWAALFTGGSFIFATFHFWIPTIVSTILALAVIIVWLWTGTADIPEKEKKHVGLGLMLPLYASGPRSVGWWAMFITMMGDMTAFGSLIFAYFFYWTIHPDFPPGPDAGPGLLWPLLGLAGLLGTWGLTLLARSWNGLGYVKRVRLLLLGAALLALIGGAALILGPWQAGLDPTADVYPATVWLLMIWAATHAAVGIIMLLYCVARSLAGRLTVVYDIDLRNVALYWHFAAITALVTVAVLALFPWVA
jgi:cytochrome c oxidase subunit I+III